MAEAARFPERTVLYSRIVMIVRSAVQEMTDAATLEGRGIRNAGEGQAT